MAALPNDRAPAVGLSGGSSSRPKPKISKSCESMNPQASTGPSYVIRGNANIINMTGSQQNTSTYVTQETVGESRNPQTSTGPTFFIGGNANIINMIGSQQNMSKDPPTPAPTIIVNGVNNSQIGTPRN